MRTFLRGKMTLLFLTLGLLIAIPAIALADVINTDANATTVVVESAVSKAPGDTGAVKVWLTQADPNDDVGGCNATSTNKVSVALSSPDSDITFDSSGTKANPALLEDCGPTNGKEIGYTVKSTATGPFPKTITVTASGSGGKSTGPVSDPNLPSYVDDTFTITITAPPNTAPSTPGKPGLAGTSNTPNQGVFDVAWGGSTDDGKPNPPAAVTYTLQHKDANDASYSDVATGISGTSYSFTSTSKEAEGTWTYQVRASDGSLTSAFSTASDPIKVDKSNPNAPSASAPTPDYNPTGTANDWYKDSVTVSFSANGDPNLLDGSAGSGVNLSTLTAPIVKNTSGPHTVSGTVKDNVGLESAAGSLTVQVDATNPTVNITGCPTDTVGYNSTHNITVAASDAHSGLVSDPSGSVPLDTTTARGPQTKTIQVQDNVGHTAQATCNYTVNRLPSDPGAPVLDSGSSNPNQGEFKLNWNASTDADNNFDHYVLQHKDNDDADFSDVTGATDLSNNSYTFPAGSKEAEGTWTYRVKAVDDFEDSGYATSTANLVKVDKSNPNAPSASAPTPDYNPTGTANDWYKDSVTVSFSANGDPNLLDGSAGSGVNLSTLTAPIVKNTSGPHTVSGTVKDNVGLESAAGSLTVQVDATNPTVNITGCPTDTVGYNSTHNITVAASDAHSGLVSDPSGSVPLDTTTARGPQTKTIQVQDNVGHTAQATCNYTVNRLPSDPGAPVLDSGSSNPNQGEFKLNWNASTDADNNFDHYVLQHKDNDDADFSDVTGATDLSNNSYTFPAGSKEAEGTWTYRVKAVDDFEDSGYATSAANLVKVDKTGPSAPTANFNSTQAAVDGWYKDSVTITYNGSTDPNLLDNSAGSGGIVYTDCPAAQRSGREQLLRYGYGCRRQRLAPDERIGQRGHPGS